VAFLRSNGLDVIDVCEMGWQSTDDRTILERATNDNRVLVTRDGDFGQLIFQEGCACYGVVRLKPGHLVAAEAIAMLTELIQSQLLLNPPFMAVLTKQTTQTTIRIRAV
jgi:predicted nuclease of predicted toxin-antitoxin system